MIGLKNSYEIAYNGTENECRFELYADTAADLQGLTHIDGIKIQMGSECTDIATGDKYLLNGSGVWVLQQSANVWENVYTKAEIDSMTTEIYGIIAYYHTTLVSDTGEIAFYSLGGNVVTWTIYGNGQQTGTPTPEFVGVRTAQLFDKSTITQGYYVSDTSGALVTSPAYENDANASDYIPISGDSITIYSNPIGKWRWGAFYDSNKTFISGIAGYNQTLTIPENARYIRLTVVDDILDTLMVNLGNTALPYEPFGYKIPISCGGQTNNIYLSAPLRKAIDGTDAVDTLQSTGTLTRNVDENGDALVTPTTETITVPDIPTVQGENTLTVDTDLKPSKIEISGER